RTSSRVMTPPGPVPGTRARSTPKSFASLRTGGLANTPLSLRGRLAGSSGAGALRARRVAVGTFVPYPTSTSPLASPLPLASASASSLAISAGAAGGSSAGPVGSRSIVTMGVPTSTVSPTSASSSVTIPACGLGSSTRDLAVSISTRTSLTSTRSPTAIFQSTISASVSPSPTSGSGKLMYFGIFAPHLIRHRLFKGVKYPIQPRQVFFLELRDRVGGVEPAHAHHRRLQVVEA